MARTRTVDPVSTVPGTKEWADTVTANARRYAKFAEQDVRPLVERYQALCDHEAWMSWFTDEPKTRERFCREALGYEAEFLDAMSAGVTLLDAQGHTGAVTVQAAQRAVAAWDRAQVALRDAMKALDQVDLPKNGQVGRGRADSFDNIKAIGGTSESYLRRRLKRDHRALYDEVAAGRQSAHAAAVQAGFQSRTLTVKPDDPSSVARSLRRNMTAENIAILVQLLKE